MCPALLVLFASLLGLAYAEVTIYGLTGQTTIHPLDSSSAVPTATTTSFVTTQGPPQYTGLAAYNPVYMLPPPIPDPAPANQFTISLPQDAQHQSDLSIKQQGTFFGFSIEMSVANQLSEYQSFAWQYRASSLSMYFSRNKQVSDSVCMAI